MYNRGYVKGGFALNRVIFHVDVNSAFLSWEAVERLKNEGGQDIREIPSVVAGDPRSRRGVVLAKSQMAKEFGIKTGEPLYWAVQKCPSIIIVPPHHEMYLRYSRDMLKILQSYTPLVERYSIDECFCDFTNMVKGKNETLDLAYKIKDHIKNALGFTVNVGVSTNKLLAKMASDFKKPDRVHTLYPEEIEEKMWPLPVEELFMVGKATVPKLHKMNIHTIGDLAKYDVNLVRDKLKSHGVTIWNYARGIENSPVDENSRVKSKGMGNSTTIASDVQDRENAHKILISLCEELCVRLRKSENRCYVVSVNIGLSDFTSFSRQKKLFTPTDSTKTIMDVALKLFDELWDGAPIRKLGIYLSELTDHEYYQPSFFDIEKNEKQKALDSALDKLKEKYGSDVVTRSCLLKGKGSKK